MALAGVSRFARVAEELNTSRTAKFQRVRVVVGGVGSVARCVDCMMICAASVSPTDGSSGQADIECVVQLSLAVAMLFKPGTPPLWPNLLDSFLMLRSTSAAVTRVGCPGGDFQLAIDSAAGSGTIKFAGPRHHVSIERQLRLLAERQPRVVGEGDFQARRFSG